MSTLPADGFPDADVRHRARRGPAAAFPAVGSYGKALFGGSPAQRRATDALDELRLVPPVFMPARQDKLIELGREPSYRDVDLDTTIGGFRSPLPAYISAFGSTQVAGGDLGLAVSRQAGRVGVPMVIGENVVPVSGYGRLDADVQRSMRARISAYADAVPDTLGGVVVQQSTEDADAEVWNLVYSDPVATSLLDTGRLAFELKIGQGAKPGLGGLTVLSASEALRLADRFEIDPLFGSDAADDSPRLRAGVPGTFTEEILRQQIRLMRNNFPRVRVWVKLHPGRDIHRAAAVAWAAGADAVAVDGAEGGSGWAPLAFLDHVGLPLAECLRRIGRPAGCLRASGRIADGARAATCLALGARAVGLGRAALLAADEDPDQGLIRLIDCLAFELRLLISAVGKYEAGALDTDDLWAAGPSDPSVHDRPHDQPHDVHLQLERASA
ncbi:MAG TPA: glutamate synthase-related protein [Microlunatus sp.]|nr:glutamate synthase-related protein [Microlunatus sp.]